MIILVIQAIAHRSLKKSGPNGARTRGPATPVGRSNQPSHEATDVGSWSFVSSNEPVKNGFEVIYEMFHILNCGFEMKHFIYHFSIVYTL